MTQQNSNSVQKNVTKFLHTTPLQAPAPCNIDYVTGIFLKACSLSSWGKGSPPCAWP